MLAIVILKNDVYSIKMTLGSRDKTIQFKQKNIIL